MENICINVYSTFPLEIHHEIFHLEKEIFKKYTLCPKDYKTFRKKRPIEKIFGGVVSSNGKYIACALFYRLNPLHVNCMMICTIPNFRKQSIITNLLSDCIKNREFNEVRYLSFFTKNETMLRTIFNKHAKPINEGIKLYELERNLLDDYRKNKLISESTSSNTRKLNNFYKFTNGNFLPAYFITYELWKQ